MQRRTFLALLLSLFAATAFAGNDPSDETLWNNTLKSKYFAGKSIEESNAVVELTAPYRAEDPSLVPVQITAKFPQSGDRYIKTITLIIDANPAPVAGTFHFTPDSGKADLAMRLRINAYSHVRAIAETNDGKLTMHKVFVKASGGCSAPIGADAEAAMARLGKMKFRLDGQPAPGQPTLAQLLISHPNITGMQMDQISRMVQPAHYIDRIKISFNGKPVLSAETDISISADPNFRFYFVPRESGELKAEVHDMKGGQWTSSEQVKL
ncbi:quinoprotein dehydrogenase-associated SoxYZ-like carrier [Methylogaea oryzae]|uniref:Quinoprotein dehydrogenase-associated SoxYZ-like carrier n=1 Tax=Methylogaea oryzae TaxID=1295382 RepID=A0A8D4VQ88_9GAMM|nr:quinoprotein dehydrogenase-associated SoxYZ-like carrier [Methylogaea oryzae]BBL72488.1 quinoprotein dehydrogenase-associated SoxYZ-like carrier [Methylogaea oryzae]